jgi:hypothetical protein
MTWPIIEGVSLHAPGTSTAASVDGARPAHRRRPKEVFRDLAKDADAVIEGMRPGALAKRGLGYDDLKAINPKIVFCTISGYGMTGPYKDMPSHGIAYDTWGGLVKPETDDDGFCFIPEHPSTGIHAGPLFGAFGILVRHLPRPRHRRGLRPSRSRSPMRPPPWTGYRSETWKAYERPEDEVTGNKAATTTSAAPRAPPA